MCILFLYAQYMISQYMYDYILNRHCLLLTSMDMLLHKRIIKIICKSKRFGCSLNLSKYHLSTTNSVLFRGLQFCIPSCLLRERIFCGIWIFFHSNFETSPLSPDKFSTLKASDLAHAYAGTLVNHIEFKWHCEYFCGINSVDCNRFLIITKPNKSIGVVAMDYNNYINKIVILSDGDKIIRLGLIKTQYKKVNRVELSKVLSQFG